MRMKAAILFVALVNVSLTAQDTKTSFRVAFKEASYYAIQYNDPASIQKGINLYYSIIETFPNDPDVYKAKVAVFDILKSEGSVRSLFQACDIIKELLGEVDLKSSIGQDIALKFADFHIHSARGYSLQGIEETKRVLGQLRTQTIGKKHSLLLLRITSREANILTHEKEEIASLKKSISMLKECNKWGQDDGFWSDLCENDIAQYQEYMQQLRRIESSSCWAIDRSNNPQISTILRQEPLILMQYESMRKALREFELKYCLGIQKEIEKVQDQLFEDLTLSTNLPTNTQTVLGQDSTKDIVIDVSLESEGDPSQQDKRQPEVLEDAQETEVKAVPEQVLSKSNRIWLITGVFTLGVVTLPMTFL